MKEIEKLKELGLYVQAKSKVGPYANGYLIGKIKSDLADKRICLNASTNDGRKIELVEYGYLYPKTSSWIFEVWEGIPGPGEDDVICEFELLENAVDTAINFFFGKSTIINGWIFPLHKHPELQANLVELAINNALKVSKIQFDKILEKYTDEFWDNTEISFWDMALKCCFLKILPAIDSNAVLMLRRDLLESYLVFH